MDTTTRRTMPAPLLIGFGVWIAFAAVRLVTIYVVKFDAMFSSRLQMTGEGISFACNLLVLLGVIELMNRSAGKTRSMLVLAAYGAGIAFAADVLAGFVNFSSHAWDHKWVYDAYSVAALVSWSAFAVGLTLAGPGSRRALGFAALAITIVVWLPMDLSNKLWHAIGLESKTLYAVETLLNMVRLGLLAAVAYGIKDGTTTPQPMQAADGMRLAAKGLWIRVIAACVVVMFTLMMIGGGSGGGGGSISFFKLIMMSQAIVGVIALTMTGLGALRSARSGVREIEPYIFTIGGGISLWAAGVSLAQMPMVYRAMYGGESMSGREMRELASVMSVALPVVVIVGVGMLATALSGFAARRGNDDLRSEAQGKGIGYVVLLLVAMAIQNWMLPESRSIGNFALLTLLAAGASLWGTVIMAKLLGRGADAFEAEPTLPTASVID